MGRRKAVFLDRDGTINEECGYLHRIEDCRFIEGVLTAVARLNDAGYLVVVVTNQSGIARGYYGAAELNELHRYMSEVLAAAGARVDAWYHCPHHPEHSGADADCNCRKPFPGMLLQAAADLDIDLAGSWMIGDKIADVDAGHAAGCRSLLVATGYGLATAAALAGQVPVFPGLDGAVEYILAAEGQSFKGA